MKNRLPKENPCRHPGEGRDPVFETESESSITDWTPAFAGATGKVMFLVLGLFLLTRLCGAGELDLPTRYREAVAVYRQGDYKKAQDLFKSVQEVQPSYKRTTSYLAKCRERLVRDGPTMAYYDRADAEARDILNLRKTLLDHVRTQYQTVTITEEDGKVFFAFPSRFLFPGNGNDYSGAGTAFLGLVKDYALTYRSLHLGIVSQQPAGQKTDAARRNERRAVSLGSYFFRHGGLPPQNIRIRARTGEGPLIQLQLSALPPKEVANEAAIRGAMAEVTDPMIDPDKDWPLPIDLSLLDPARVKSWSLKFLGTERGDLVREFRGTSDVWVSLRWDGNAENGRPARAGEYQAFLSALTLSGERLEDSSAFVIRPTKPRQNDLKIPSPEQIPPPSAQSRKWAHVIRFSFNQGDLAGTGGLEVKQLAQSIKSFPDESVVIEGFADDTEENAEELARRRGEKIRSLLTDQHGIPPERLSVRAKEPRRALEGENLQKAVVFFVEGESPSK